MRGRAPLVVVLAWASLAAWLLLTRGLYPSAPPPPGAAGAR